MTAPLKIRPVSDPVEECNECDGTGTRQCEDCGGRGGTECECSECGHEHERQCRTCGTRGYYACDVCHGFACMVAAREWERDMVLPLIPSEVLRTLVQIAPRLDALALPRFGVRSEQHSARPVITIEVRRGDTETRAALKALGGWERAKLPDRPERPQWRQWNWIGAAVRTTMPRQDWRLQ